VARYTLLVLGQFPAADAHSPRGTAVLHCADQLDVHRLIPLLPVAAR
jgi:hypothetical protein